MKVLVTGTSGFVGLNIARMLAAGGHDVLAVDRNPADRWVGAYLADVSRHITHFQADLAQPGALAAALPEGHVDAVVHATVVTATTTEVELQRARDVVDSNVGGTVEALEAAVARGARRFIYVSSPSALGDVAAIRAIDEDARPQPTTLYGITKLASELIVARWTVLGRVDGASVRIAQPCGPGERATGARVRTSPIWEWLRDAAGGEPLPTGPLDRARDWTYIDDTARGIAALVTAGKLAHDLYHLSTGVSVIVADVIHELEAEFGPLAVDEQPNPERLNPNIAGPARPPLDPSRFEREFGWKPSTGIADGMQRYLDWWRRFRGTVTLDAL